MVAIGLAKVGATRASINIYHEPLSSSTKPENTFEIIVSEVCFAERINMLNFNSAS